MATQQVRILSYHAVADVAAAVALGVAALIANHKSNQGEFDYGGPLVFGLWALAVAVLVHGVALLIGLGILEYKNE
jgi:divalent metal cation (Fe/Co/Zn/Cd) transporter